MEWVPWVVVGAVSVTSLVLFAVLFRSCLH